MFEQYKITLMMIGAGIIGLSMFALYSHGRSLEISNQQIKNERDQYKQGLEYQNAQILSNKVDYDHNLAEANKTNTMIQTRYKDRVQVIYQWGENNATDCNSSMHYLNNYIF